jgi:hypothetical protein
MERIMTTRRLEELLAAYGSESRRWPEAERAKALALMERLPELRPLMDRERALDAILDRKQDMISAATVARVSARIGQRLSEHPPAREKSSPISWLVSPLATAIWPRAAAFAGIAMLGVIIGLSSDPSAFSTTTSAFDGSVDTGETSLIGEFSSWSE